MASSAQIPFNERVMTYAGRKYIEVSFYMETLKMRDELIQEQLAEIQRLKKRVNKLTQAKPGSHTRAKGVEDDYKNTRR